MKPSMVAAAVWLATLPCIAAAQSVVTYHNSPARSGEYVVPGLTKTAAANLHQDPGFKTTLIGRVYAQPLYWQPPDGSQGLLIVATEANLVYALDATTGAFVWSTHLKKAAPLSALGCGDIVPEGVTGTPSSTRRRRRCTWMP